MPYSTAVRDRYRVAVAAVSGLTAIAALSATGWLAGTAAQATDSKQADQAGQAGKDAAARAAWRASRHPTRAAAVASRDRRVVLKQRPQLTHVTTRYVQGAPAAPVGSGGTVSHPASQPVSHAPSGSAPAPHPAPAPPPAPSSGS